MFKNCHSCEKVSDEKFTINVFFKEIFKIGDSINYQNISSTRVSGGTTIVHVCEYANWSCKNHLNHITCFRLNLRKEDL